MPRTGCVRDDMCQERRWILVIIIWIKLLTGLSLSCYSSPRWSPFCCLHKRYLLNWDIRDYGFNNDYGIFLKKRYLYNTNINESIYANQLILITFCKIGFLNITKTPDYNVWKQPSKGIHRKRFSEKRQQIYRRTLMPKFPCTFEAHFQNTFS